MKINLCLLLSFFLVFVPVTYCYALSESDFECIILTMNYPNAESIPSWWSNSGSKATGVDWAPDTLTIVRTGHTYKTGGNYYNSGTMYLAGWKIDTQAWYQISAKGLYCKFCGDNNNWDPSSFENIDAWGINYVSDLNGTTCEDWTPPCHDEYANLIQTCDGGENIINWDETTCTGQCDLCPNDPNKIVPGTCGCGAPDDANNDGFIDCLNAGPCESQ